ncbi:tyrosine protein phosphatase [Aquibacillus sp. 3ASR75-11]|uniref:Tyrosine-protein phosphatase n=1 Tax=Terrihalobacillus insolitus TaxID=2950438 RepID=A0A9X3WRG2_9BACI|nr:CpsB/CapC family capsule biosynthesis tyrosine phosphatase [Terrihalobacillus insolitus]MDC3423493.1 tyrosine protein phosphatase [Terrihalobacillus insolitus]
MIDIHCHILPALDDGAKHMEESIAMAKTAVSQGIHTIVATPHHRNGRYTNVKLDIVENVHYLNERLQEEDVPLTILPGQETRINGDMITDIQQGHVLPLNETSGYLFIELPSGHVPRYTRQLLFDLQVEGYKPIIVHPERNAELIENPDQLYEFVKNGTLTQITAASVIGKFGKKIQRFSQQLIESNLTHFVASDAHNTTTRGFTMQEANQFIGDTYGNEMVYFFMENAQFLLDGEAVVGDVPERVKRRKILGLF